MLRCWSNRALPAHRRNCAGCRSRCRGGSDERAAKGSSGIDYLVSLGGFTAIGVLIYAILRFAYWSFYNRFGVTPEEVGLGYVEILTRSAPVLVLGMTGAAAINALLARRFLGMDPPQVWRVVGVTVGLLLAAALIVSPVRAHVLAGFVERGIPVHPTSPVELVAVQVDYVTLEPGEQAAGQEQQGPSPDVGAAQAESATGTAEPATGPVQEVRQAASSNPEDSNGIEQRTSLLYFGQSNQITVLYDHVNQQVIRLPMTDVRIIAE